MSDPHSTSEKQLVLNVDDNEPARYAKGRILTEHGYRVLEAATGPDAIRVATEHRPDVILLDVGLPEIDGIEVSRRLKAAPKGLAEEDATAAAKP